MQDLALCLQTHCLLYYLLSNQLSEQNPKIPIFQNEMKQLMKWFTCSLIAFLSIVQYRKHFIKISVVPPLTMIK